MKQEDKELLLKDLCARLPYGVKVQKIKEPESAYRLYSIDTNSEELKFVTFDGSSLTICNGGYLERTGNLRFKPYLRPISSMTEEERDEYESTFDSVYDVDDYGEDADSWHEEFSIDSFDWLNAHHFDYRGLIEKGLALEAPEVMYKNK